MSEKNKIHVIVAPHADDEIIGNYSIISNPDNKCIIIYADYEMTQKRQAEMVSVKKKFDNIVAYMKARELPTQFLSDEYELHYPDPFHETHPHHRLIGNKGYDLFQQGYVINFYSVNMEAPYIYRTELSNKKKETLDELFPSQRSLWKNDAKYYLFEGHCCYVPEGLILGKLKEVDSPPIYKNTETKRENIVETELIIPEVVEGDNE
jgi:hypothetical protein